MKRISPVDTRRMRVLQDGSVSRGPVIYWMSRDQRAQDNWALIYSQYKARQMKSSALVVFCMVEKFLQSPQRNYRFMLEGLKEMEQVLMEYEIPFYILKGDPGKKIPKFVESHDASYFVTDFSPLRIKSNWIEEIKPKLSIPFHEIDAHNIVPCWFASKKQDFTARFFRPKIKKHVGDFLVDFPPLIHQNNVDNDSDGKKIAGLISDLPEDNGDIAEIKWLKPGEIAAQEMLQDFINEKLDYYGTQRNDPTKNVLSNLSPYIHFGQISAQRVALEVGAADADQESKDSFLEELIVRRELSDNYCYYNPNYDSFEGFPDWAKKSLKEHWDDPRDYIYSKEELESASTHDDLWNAAQIQMMEKGKMHGWLRMYWAKKILEWTQNPGLAQEVAIYLNDKYSLDGRDPNGYTGIAWSIGGVHDRAWKNRPIFGKVRYMNYNGAKRKFKVKEFVEKFQA